MGLHKLPIAWLALFAAALPLPAFAGGSEIENDLKKLKKYASPKQGSSFDTALVAPCVCLDSTGDYENALGTIEYRRVAISGGRERIGLRCIAYEYDVADGSRVALVLCEDWLPLAK